VKRERGDRVDEHRDQPPAEEEELDPLRRILLRTHPSQPPVPHEGEPGEEHDHPARAELSGHLDVLVVGLIRARERKRVVRPLGGGEELRFVRDELDLVPPEADPEQRSVAPHLVPDPEVPRPDRPRLALPELPHRSERRGRGEEEDDRRHQQAHGGDPQEGEPAEELPQSPHRGRPSPHRYGVDGALNPEHPAQGSGANGDRRQPAVPRPGPAWPEPDPKRDEQEPRHQAQPHPHLTGEEHHREDEPDRDERGDPRPRLPQPDEEDPRWQDEIGEEPGQELAVPHRGDQGISRRSGGHPDVLEEAEQGVPEPRQEEGPEEEDDLPIPKGGVHHEEEDEPEVEDDGCRLEDHPRRRPPGEGEEGREEQRGEEREEPRDLDLHLPPREGLHRPQDEEKRDGDQGVDRLCVPVLRVPRREEEGHREEEEHQPPEPQAGEPTARRHRGTAAASLAFPGLSRGHAGVYPGPAAEGKPRASSRTRAQPPTARTSGITAGHRPGRATTA